jgi:hypothetical protein
MPQLSCQRPPSHEVTRGNFFPRPGNFPQRDVARRLFCDGIAVTHAQRQTNRGRR